MVAFGGLSWGFDGEADGGTAVAATANVAAVVVDDVVVGGLWLGIVAIVGHR